MIRASYRRISGASPTRDLRLVRQVAQRLRQPEVAPDEFSLDAEDVNAGAEASRK